MLPSHLLNGFTYSKSLDDIKYAIEKARRFMAFTGYSLYVIPFIKTDKSILFTFNLKQLACALNFKQTVFLTDIKELDYRPTKRFFLSDPRFLNAISSLDRYPWQLASVLSEHGAFVNQMELHGIKSGLTVPYLCGTNHMFIMNFHFDKSLEELPQNTLGNHMWLSQIVHACYLQTMHITKSARQITKVYSSQLSALTPREIEVTKLLCLGKTTKTIAMTLEISYWMVQRHIGNAKKKLGCKNRTELSFRYNKIQWSNCLI